MNNRFDLIVFDWDGTLINSIDWICDCLQLAAEKCSLTKPPINATKNSIGLSIDKAMLSLFPEADHNLVTQLVAYYTSRGHRCGFYKPYKSRFARVICIFIFRICDRVEYIMKLISQSHSDVSTFSPVCMTC